MWYSVLMPLVLMLTGLPGELIYTAYLWQWPMGNWHNLVGVLLVVCLILWRPIGDWHYLLGILVVAYIFDRRQEDMSK